MHTSTLSSRGQTTIPVDIQKLLNVKPGDKIQYYVEVDGRVCLVPKTLSVKDLKGLLPKPKKSATIEEMNEAVLDEAAARHEQL